MVVALHKDTSPSVRRHTWRMLMPYAIAISLLVILVGGFVATLHRFGAL